MSIVFINVFEKHFKDTAIFTLFVSSPGLKNLSSHFTIPQNNVIISCHWSPYTPENARKALALFSGGTEREQQHEMG